MRSFTISTIDKKGKSKKEIILAETEQELFQMVKNRQLYLEEYRETMTETSRSKKLKLKSLVVFCRQLGTMVSSGIPIVKALDMLHEKADNSHARHVFRAVYEEVQKGNSLSNAMSLQEGAFPSLLINMILAGETGGTLDNSLMRMSSHFEKEQKLNNKIKSASIYPSILGVVSVGVVLMLVTFVLPTITQMFDPANMPWTTQLVMGFSHFITNNYGGILVFLGSITVITLLALNIREVRIQVDKIKLYLPLFGKLNQTIYSARCARALSSLYSSGVQTLDMLEITAQVLNNAYLEEVFQTVIAEVSRGVLISSAITNTASFDPMLASMIYIGEESGSLGKILNSTADYFDDESDSAIQRMVSMFEPIMLVILGFVIGFIVISIIQPIYTSYGSIGLN